MGSAKVAPKPARPTLKKNELEDTLAELNEAEGKEQKPKPLEGKQQHGAKKRRSLIVGAKRYLGFSTRSKKVAEF